MRRVDGSRLNQLSHDGKVKAAHLKSDDESFQCREDRYEEEE